MRVFVGMPFTSRHESVYSAIKEACEKAKVTHLRADEIKQPGPIIDQIFNAITSVDCMVAEVSDKNPNVYYEVGIAHSAGIPTILIARRGTVKDLPFDIQHNRVLLYDEKNLHDMIENLKEYLLLLKPSTIGSERPSTLEMYLNNLGLRGEKPEIILRGIQGRIAEVFELTDARLLEQRVVHEGIIITLQDAFGEKVTALVDVNGIIKRVKKVTK